MRVCPIARGLLMMAAIPAATVPNRVHAAETVSFPLVRDGRPVVEVVAAGGHPAIDPAVADLTQYVERISGVKLKVTRGTDDLPGPTLHIGETSLFERTPEARKAIKLDGFVIARIGEDAIIAGNIPQGTANGIYTVLQDQFGVRWYYTGPLWEVVPKAASLAITIRPNAAGGAYLENPSFYGRSVWGRMASAEFSRRMRMTQEGVKLPYVGTGHDLNHVVNPQKYGDKPEYFAFWDGKRHVEHDVHPCFTHPDMFDVFMKYVREGGRSFGVNDNQTACKCERCLAVDGQSEPYNGMWNFSESYFQLIAKVAAQTAKEFPDRQLGLFAYQLTNAPPKTVEHIGKNVSVVLCQDTSQNFDPKYRETDRRMAAEWVKKAGHVRFYDYIGINYWVPRYFPNILAGQIRHIARIGVEGYGTHHTSMIDSSMPMYYLLYQMLWNAELDPGVVIDRMMIDLYGKAAEPVGRYYKHWEECWQRQTKGRWFWGMDNFRGEMEIYKPEDFEQGRQLLDEATKLADDDKVRQRIAFLRECYEFTYAGAQAHYVSMDAIHWQPTDDYEDAITRSNAVAEAWREWTRRFDIAQKIPDLPISGWPGKTGYVRMWGLKQQMRDAALAPLVRWACANESKVEPDRLRHLERMLAGVGILNREQIESRVIREANAAYRKPRADGLLAADVPRECPIPRFSLSTPKGEARGGGSHSPTGGAETERSWHPPAADWSGIPHVDELPWVFHDRPAAPKVGKYDEPIWFYYADPPTPDDLSATWQAAWDEQRLYLRVVVRDQLHVQNQPAADMWKEDSLQIGFNPQRGNFELKAASWDYIWGGYKRNESEFGISLRDKSVQTHIWQAPKLPEGAKAEELIQATAARHGDRTIYEAAVQWQLLPGFEPKSRKSFGICLVVNDMDKGERRSAEYGSGIIRAKRPTEFAALRLAD